MIHNNSSNIEIIQWLNILARLQIPFYIYKLHLNDSIIYKSENLERKTIIILKGSLLLQKNFNNHENLCVAILHKNTLINSFHDYNNINQLSHYYKIISLNTSYIISFRNCNLLTNNKAQNLLLLKLNMAYNQSLIAYEDMIHIITHKYIKYRLIQLLLFLCKKHGMSTNNTIIIRLPISQSNIALIVGSNKNTINKIIQNLQKHKVIQYFSHNKIIIINDIMILNKFKFTE